jgi:actin-like ATPase involved in cell morphogenesis
VLTGVVEAIVEAMSVTLAPIPMELVRLSDELQSLGGGDALVSKMRVVARLVGPSPPAPCALQLDAGNADTVVISSGRHVIIDVFSAGL